MQGLKAAMAVFCTACICAELVAQITESGWARRGIKVVAGLYILAAALHVLPQLKAEGNVFSVPTVSSVELGTWEQAALAQTQTLSNVKSYTLTARKTAELLRQSLIFYKFSLFCHRIFLRTACTAKAENKYQQQYHFVFSQYPVLLS